MASYYFYMCWSTKYIFVIWGITIIDYIAGIQIENAEKLKLRKLFLTLSLFCNIGLLVLFKYLNFLTGSAGRAMHFLGLQYDIPLLHIILPVGLSFHTFQAMSYTIDVYKRKAPAERSFLNYALYVAFFPQMVAGPIERPGELLPQFHREPVATLERLKSGFAQALWGFFKKMVIADAVAGPVNAVFATPEKFQGIVLLLATLCFALQIYCDFSGYSDIALGLARAMGYDLRVNFRQPYFSRSISEFWRRWHISLSTWFRDYVYIEMGGNRVSTGRKYFNLFITFLVSGLWHGASWTFVIWGAVHGLYLIVSQLTTPIRDRLRHISGIENFPGLLTLWQTLCTFVLVTIAWVFFRAHSFDSAVYILTHFFPLGTFNSEILTTMGLPRANIPFLMVFVAALFSVEWWIANPSQRPRIWSWAPLRQACYYACLYSIVFFGVFGHLDFIYFQF